MYKVVIIDDEPIIVEGLSRLLPLEQYHCRIAATVHDRSVESRISGHGISILTGYREFDYCQKAIRLGISRFLLKPSNMTELEEALKAMTRCLRKKK